MDIQYLLPKFYKHGINEYGARVRCWVAGGNVIQEQILYRDRVVPNSKTFTSTVAVQRLRDTREFHPRTENRGKDCSQRVDEPKVPSRFPDLNPCDFLWRSSFLFARY
jgi:hypothetical protein